MQTRSLIFWVLLAIAAITAWAVILGRQKPAIEAPVTPIAEHYQPIPITPCAPDCGKN